MRRPWPQPATLRWQIQLLVGGLLLLLLVTGVASAVVQERLSTSRARLANMFRPAQVAAVALSEAYVDQETGEREFLLTGNPIQLQPYTTGIREATRLRSQLGTNLRGDPTSTTLLAGVDTAAAAWQSGTAAPEIADRQPQSMTGAQLLTRAPNDERLFNTLRAALFAVQDRTNQLANAQLQNANATQAVAARIAIGATIAALLLGGVAIVVLRRSLARPLRALVSQVHRVGDDLDHSVDVAGPTEIATVASAVDAMRVRLRAEIARATASKQQLARYEEAERIARDLNETVVQRLFRTGLNLQSMAGRQPAASGALSVAVDDIDSAIRELQTAIFGLTMRREEDGLSKRVLDVVGESETSLGFSPQVGFDGTLTGELPEPVSDDLVNTLRRILADLAAGERPLGVRIQIARSDGVLRLTVTGDRDSVAVDWPV
ncbi:MAG TPA: CHASE3 domain-containing protein [Pseudonocardiaceae bacterium]|nr:CHASE3 domain-containing protein [Pseudonocardiaceae bacterium]